MKLVNSKSLLTAALAGLILAGLGGLAWAQQTDSASAPVPTITYQKPNAQNATYANTSGSAGSCTGGVNNCYPPPKGNCTSNCGAPTYYYKQDPNSSDVVTYKTITVRTGNYCKYQTCYYTPYTGYYIPWLQCIEGSNICSKASMSSTAQREAVAYQNLTVNYQNTFVSQVAGVFNNANGESGDLTNGKCLSDTSKYGEYGCAKTPTPQSWTDGQTATFFWAPGNTEVDTGTYPIDPGGCNDIPPGDQCP